MASQLDSRRQRNGWDDHTSERRRSDLHGPGQRTGPACCDGHGSASGKCGNRGFGNRYGGGAGIDPRIVSITLSQTVQFQVSGPNLSNSNVTWSVDNSGAGSTSTGTISSNGLYAPPNVAGSHTITATSGLSQSNHY